MQKRIVLLLVVLQFYLTLSVPYLNQYNIQKRRKLCGQVLSDTLTLVCQGEYAAPSKKSFTDLSNYNNQIYDEEILADENEVSHDWFPAMYNQLRTNYRSRKSYGIVEECCFNACSRENLRKYCAS